jgi:hypothetical protein
VLLGVVDGTAVVVPEDGAVVGSVVVGAVVDGAVVGPAVVPVVVLVVVGPVVVGPAVVPGVVPGVVPVVVGSDVGPAVEVPGSVVGVPVDGGSSHGVPGARVAVDDGMTGLNGFPTGRDGRVLERDVPSVRSTVGLDEAGGSWVVAASGFPNGTKNQVPARAATMVASAPSFRIGWRRRLCRAPNFRACRPRWNCLTSKPFAPRPRGSLPTRTLQSKLTTST